MMAGRYAHAKQFSAVGHNLRLVRAWLRMILRSFFVALFWSFTTLGGLKSAS
jgi:hypothetical protein